METGRYLEIGGPLNSIESLLRSVREPLGGDRFDRRGSMTRLKAKIRRYQYDGTYITTSIDHSSII